MDHDGATVRNQLTNWRRKEQMSTEERRWRPVLHVWRDRLRRALWFATADAALQALGRVAVAGEPG